MARHERPDGFSLVELLVVLSILAVLLLISLPTFVGTAGRARDRAAQSNLRTAYASAKVLLASSGTYADADAFALEAEEAQLDFRPAPAESREPDEVSVNPVSASEWVGTVLSASGTCFVLRDRAAAGAGTRYASWTATVSDPCDASNPMALGASARSW